MYSNLIKSGIITVDGRKKRVIDSDSIFNAGFRPLVFERVEEIGTENQEIEETAVSEDEIMLEGGLTPEQTDLLFHADSDEAAVQMLLNKQGGASQKKKASVLSEKQGGKKETSQQAEQEIKKAKEEAEGLLEEAKAQAEILLEQAQKEAEGLAETARQQGFEQGYQEGMLQAQAEIENVRQQLEQKEQQLQDEYEQQVTALEPQIVGFISDIVKKLTGVVLSERGDILTHLVSCCMEGIERSGLYLIHVSKEDYYDMLERKSELESRVETASEVRIVEDASLRKNQCLIETDTTIYDSSLDLQMERLCEDLKLLSLEVENQDR